MTSWVQNQNRSSFKGVLELWLNVLVMLACLALVGGIAYTRDKNLWSGMEQFTTHNCVGLEYSLPFLHRWRGLLQAPPGRCKSPRRTGHGCAASAGK